MKKSDFKLFGGEMLTVFGQEIKVLEKVYAILYKSAGYISSDEDEFGYPSYKKQMLDCPYVHLLHVAGRLDVDTEGLLLLSNDGQFIHQVIKKKNMKSGSNRRSALQTANSFKTEFSLMMATLPNQQKSSNLKKRKSS